MAGSEQVFALYDKIKKSVVKDIELGKLKPDDRVPSETQLARIFNASRMTANRALKELTEEGRIVRAQGVGSFVARPKPDVALLEIKSIAKEIKDWGGVHSSQIMVLKEEKVTEQIAQNMDLNLEDTIFHSIILHKDRGMCVQYSERFINPKVAPHYLSQDFKKITPSEYLLEVAPIQEAEHIIEAVTCKSQIQKCLKIQPDEPCISLKRRTWSFDVVATYSIIISPGSRYKLKGKFIRG
ncbi:MAG: histidine utilization repressor [Desulfobacula sp.]|uniref:histidine utilization repressor n=1 Tax=Desulfobacula sp. TaxID=2593537 RepID=UPI0025B9253C|nr:histidine utilization repressor [Desulfobacula sp.]MCD4719980.1 histidine utilization repressor [Desulfobacula sp.]